MRIRSLRNLLVVLSFLLITAYTAAGKVIYVDVDAIGANDGSSWIDSFNYLRQALAVSSNGDEIRVAQGVYKPHEPVATPPPTPTPLPPGPPDRTATFQLINGVVVKGGYAGLGEPDPDARDTGLYETILSGDLLGNDIDVNEAWDVWREPSFVDNSYHVVTGSGTNSTATLDGFTITGGCASGPESYDNNDVLLSSGAGMLNDSGSPTVINCTFRKNRTWTWYGQIDSESDFDNGNPSLESTYIFLPETSGAAVFNRNGSPTFSNCLFEDNVAFGPDASCAGAGVCNINNSPLLVNCVFKANVTTGFDSEYFGGAMANYNSSPRLRYCLFVDNIAEFSFGGAIYSEESNLNLMNCTFRGNEAGGGNGGAMLVNGGNSTLTSCMFDENTAYIYGGGMCIGDGLATLTGCTFTDNVASNGGALYSDFRNSLTLKGCTFVRNMADNYGGAIENSGAWYNDPNSVTLIEDCVFTANSAYMGGGIQNGWNRKNLTVVNCLFAANTASNAGGGVYNDDCEQVLINCTFTSNSAPAGNAFASDLYSLPNPSSYQISNCIIRDGEDGIRCGDESAVTITYSDVEGGWPGEGNIDAAPCFVEPGYWDVNETPADANDDFWVDGDYHLLDGSPCIDAGDNSAVPPAVTTDLDGNLRIKNDIVDMGAYESRAVFFVDIDATGANDGSSWTDAFNRIEDAVTIALFGDEIRVAQGTYRPTPPPPYQASNPNPADGATEVGTTVVLSWTAGSGAMSHDVYFGTTSPGELRGNQTITTFDPGAMAPGTTYYWRIDEVSTWGTTTGEVWRFRTEVGPPPSLPSVTAAGSVSATSITDHCRLGTFVLKNGIIIKGGYAGFGEPDPDARDIDAYRTILSGDMNGDDVEVNDPCDLLTDPSRADNCYHVVTSSEFDYYGPNTILDGFTITGGNADGQYPDWELEAGGGMYNRYSSPTVINCTFTENSARSGGGMDNEAGWPYLINCTFSRNFSNWGGGLANGARPTLIDCTFIGNVSSYKGGAMACGDGSPPMDNCTFIDNRAVIGGAIYGGDCTPEPTNCTFIGNNAFRGGVVYNNDSSIVLRNCKLTGNWATLGGVIYDDEGGSSLRNCLLSGNTAVSGGVIYSGDESSARLTNCVLTGNTAETGGVVYICDDSSVKLIHCTVSDNSADNGNAFACDSYLQQYRSSVEIINSILWDGGSEIWNNDGSEISITYSDVQGGWPGEGNIDAEPLFIEVGYHDLNDIWIDGDYRLRAGSPCIDGGTDAEVYTDIEGNIRPFDFPGADNNFELPDFDIGAYEAAVTIEGELLIQPHTVSRNARSKKIFALMRLPESIAEDDVDMSEPLVLYPGAIEATEQVLFSPEGTAQSGVRIRGVFDRAELLGAVPDSEDVDVTVIGRLKSGEYFYGTNTLTVR